MKQQKIIDYLNSTDFDKQTLESIQDIITHKLKNLDYKDWYQQISSFDKDHQFTNQIQKTELSYNSHQTIHNPELYFVDNFTYKIHRYYGKNIIDSLTIYEDYDEGLYKNCWSFEGTPEEWKSQNNPNNACPTEYLNYGIFLWSHYLTTN